MRGVGTGSEVVARLGPGEGLAWNESHAVGLSGGDEWGEEEGEEEKCKCERVLKDGSAALKVMNRKRGHFSGL